MLSHHDIDARISEGRIKISYAFLPADHKSSDKAIYHDPPRQVNLKESETQAALFFRKHMYSTHLHLTTGPVIQTHRRHRVGGRKAFRHYSDCFDLREQNEIVFEPYETLTILTNEEISLDGNTAAIVTPRVTNTDSGLILTTAYIDPYYEGIMRVVISNVTPKRQTLRVLEPLAQCFFFDLSSPICESFKEKFSQNTKFFGHTWAIVLNGDGDPFPRQKKPNPDRNLLDALRRMIRPYLTLPKIIAFFTAGGAGIVLLHFVISAYSAVTGYSPLRSDVDALKGSMSATRESIPQAGNSLIVIPAEASEGSVSLKIGILSTFSSHVWISEDRASAGNQDDVNLSYELTPSGSSGDTGLKLIARSRNGPVKSDTRIPVLWLITR